MRKHASTLAIILAIVALFAVAMVLGTRQSTGDGETFIGTDSAATTHIEENHPGYTQWFQPIFEPSSGEVESGLFALQAALGAGALGFVLGTMRERRRQRRSAADDSSRPVSDPEPACDAAEPQSRG